MLFWKTLKTIKEKSLFFWGKLSNLWRYSCISQREHSNLQRKYWIQILLLNCILKDCSFKQISILESLSKLFVEQWCVFLSGKWLEIIQLMTVNSSLFFVCRYMQKTWWMQIGVHSSRLTTKIRSCIQTFSILEKKMMENLSSRRPKK